MLKETTINDKNNTKVILNLHQGHFKVKIAKKNLKISTFLSACSSVKHHLGQNIYLQNMYQIDNLVIVITHSHYMSQYIV